MSFVNGNPWNDTEIQRLRTLWDEGLSINKIGENMGRSKNSVISKVHQLDFPSRPSPVKRPETGEEKPALTYRERRKLYTNRQPMGGSTLPTLPSLADHND